jgi:superfamily II DNA or RNA helicase
VLADQTSSVPGRRLRHRVTLRPEQRAARQALLAHRDGVLVAPCGSGKTTIGLALVAALRQRTLVLVHTVDLVDQWIARASSELGARVGRDLAADDLDVVVTTVQGLARLPFARLVDVVAPFGLLILDEAHHAPASTFTKILSAVPARWRYGLTATPTRRDGLTPLMHAHLGPVRYAVKRAQLRASGSLVVPDVHLVDYRRVPGLPVEEDEGRNRLVLRTARKLAREGRTTFLFVRLVDHARELGEQLARNHSTRVLTGDVSRAERRRILEEVRAGNVRTTVVTRLGDEGLDVPNMDAVILGTPTDTALEQRVGRALRPSPGRKPVVYDIVEPTHRARRQQRYAAMFRGAQ